MSSMPAVSGHRISQSQLPIISPANAARPGDSTCHSGNSWLSNLTSACDGPEAKPLPGSGPSSPANLAPRPTPSSSETSSISPGPPTGPGPDNATTQALVPVRSSPAPANPVTSQAVGSGHGSHTGTATQRSSPSSPAAVGLCTDRSGCTCPCTSQCHALVQALGSRTGPPQRGQVGAVFMTTDRYATDRERQVPFVVSQRLSAPGSVVLPPAAPRRTGTRSRRCAGRQPADADLCHPADTAGLIPRRVLVHPLPPGGYAPARPWALFASEHVGWVRSNGGFAGDHRDGYSQCQGGGYHDSELQQRDVDYRQDAEMAGEDLPGYAAADQACRDADGQRRGGERGRLPGRGAADLAAGEAERAQDREIAAAPPYGGHEQVRDRRQRKTAERDAQQHRQAPYAAEVDQVGRRCGSLNDERAGPGGLGCERARRGRRVGTGAEPD